MSRILKGYESKFRDVLEHMGTRRLEAGVQWLVQRAQRLSADKGLSSADGLTLVYDELAAKAARRNAQPGKVTLKFFCDAGLGGLARWLRAAGYEALWVPGIDDKVLLHEARKASAVILTTDSLLMEHGIIRDRIIPALWLPPTLKMPEQLALVFREFNLTVSAPRCTACSGELRSGDKEALKERIPPKTYRWLDEFFVCARCGKLFWHGTHWQRISTSLGSLKRERR